MKKLHVGPNRNWRVVLEKYVPSTIKRFRLIIQAGLDCKELTNTCNFPSCGLCKIIFPETVGDAGCPCDIFYKKEVVAFAKKALKEIEDEGIS